MNELWLSIKAWTQRILLALLAIYAGFFIYKNSGSDVKFWFWFNHVHSTSVFFLTSGAFVAGIVFTILVSTALKTLRQIRELRGRSRQDKLEREISDMKAKAAMLQTRPVTDPTVPPNP
jgi:uncharacterized integral membrane protein